MPSNKSASDSADVFTKPANGKTAGSYFTDGGWNIGGWSTYPSADELAINKSGRSVPASPKTANK